MPVFLPPVSRRKFLSRSIAAGMGLALNPRLFAADSKADASHWALLADPHIAAERSQVSGGINMASHLAQVTQELVALSGGAAGVFVAGDCAHVKGEKSDYVTLTSLLQPVREARLPIWLALGNHDNRERFWDTLQEEKSAPRPLMDRQVALVKTPLANWFLLDSLETTLSVPGLLGPEQLDWLAQALEANPDKPALVLLHHPPTKMENIDGLKDGEALFRVIRRRKQVKACIFGHTHRWGVTKDGSGIHLVNLPPVAYVFRDGDPSGWVYATLEPGGARLELRCVDRTHKANGEIIRLDWRT